MGLKNGNDGEEGGVWKSLNKIKAARYRIGFNLWDLLRPLDPNKTSLVSASQFLSVIMGPMRDLIGLTAEDIKNVTDYFSTIDGRVFYTMFCEYIQDEGDQVDEGEFKTNPIGVNELSPYEQKRLYLILSLVAESVYVKDYILRPLHQAYIPHSKKGGLISHVMFRQILRFLGPKLQAKDVQLLVKRYKQDERALRYKAFVREVNGTISYLTDIGMWDTNRKLKAVFDADVLDDDILNYLQPEIVPEVNLPVVGIKKIYGPASHCITPPEETLRMMKKIRDHVAKEKIRAEDYFKCFDSTNSGQLPVSDFLKGLAEMSKTWRRQRTVLYLSPREINNLCQLYTDPKDSRFIVWKAFCKEVEEVFNEKDLEKWPEMRKREIRDDFNEQKRLAAERKKAEEIESRITLEDVLTEIRSTVEQRGICLKPLAVKLDGNEDGHLTKDMIKLVFTDSNIFLTGRQLDILWNEYNDGTGFMYHSFFRDLRNIPYSSPETIAAVKAEEEKSKRKEEIMKKMEDELQHNIVEILAFIKRKLICLRMKALDLLLPYDFSNNNLVNRDDFKKAMEASKVELSQVQLGVVMDVFSLPEDKNQIEYRRFCRTVDEDSKQPCLTRVPLEEAMDRQVAKTLPVHGYVNFTERQTISVACAKLCKIISLGNIDQFKIYDKNGTGTITKFDFLSALIVLKAHTLLTQKEVDTLVKGFGVMRQLDYELDYTSFLDALDIVFRTQKAAQV